MAAPGAAASVCFSSLLLPRGRHLAQGPGRGYSVSRANQLADLTIGKLPLSQSRRHGTTEVLEPRSHRGFGPLERGHLGTHPAPTPRIAGSQRQGVTRFYPYVSTECEATQPDSEPGPRGSDTKRTKASASRGRPSLPRLVGQGLAHRRHGSPVLPPLPLPRPSPSHSFRSREVPLRV